MGALLIPCTLLLALVASAAARCNCDGDLKTEMDHVGSRLNHMFSQLHDINDHVDATIKATSSKIQDLEELTERVEHLEGGCDHGYFMCDDEDQTCVSSLSVCDGDSDCPNGRDEVNSTCDVPFTAGSHWDGEVFSDTCTQRRPHKYEMNILSIVKTNFFTSRVKVTADVISHSDTHDAHSADRLRVHGHYDFADRTLVLDPPEDDRLGISCVFHRGNHHHCHGHIFREATHENCASFKLFHRE